MASSKSFFGKRRGSTKNFTFTVFNGKQITKEKAEQVKNPRTLAQMRNRMVLTTSSAAYAAMKEIVDHSFQGYTYGLQNMSRFQSVNNKLLRENIAAETPQFAYCEYGQAKLLPGAYVVSEGNLSPINSNVLTIRTNTAGTVIVSLNISLTADTLSPNAILGKLGIGVGDMITVVVVWPVGDSGKYAFDFIRLKAVKGGDDIIQASDIKDYFDLESSSPCNFGSLGFNIFEYYFDAPNLIANASVGFAAIHSAMRNGIWERSAESLAWPDGFAFNPNPNTAIGTYPVGGSYVLNGGDAIDGYAEGSAQHETPEP